MRRTVQRKKDGNIVKPLSITGEGLKYTFYLKGLFLNQIKNAYTLDNIRSNGKFKT